MLRYTVKHGPDGLEVRFHQLRNTLWQIPFALVPIGLGISVIWYFARRMGHETTWGVFIDIGIESILIIGGVFVLLGLRFLIEVLTTSRFLFRGDGILLMRATLGLPRKSLWYAKTGIYAFGPAVRSHTREPVLKFAYPGEGNWIVLAYNTNESDANEFVEFLQREGYKFNSSWDEPARPSKALNFVTGL